MLTEIVMRSFLFVLCLAFADVSASASRGQQQDDYDNPWSDFSEVRPDVHPDGWSVDRLARFNDTELMLRSSEGAMLRWVSMSQIRVLSNVREDISTRAEQKVDFYIIQGDKPNAAAGYREGVATMFVNFGMMDLIGEDLHMWAALIGHEIAHIKLKHIEDRSNRSVPLAVLKGAAQAALGADRLASTAGGWLIDSVGLKFDRDAERQSDYMGVIWAIEAGFEADGAVRLHMMMSEKSSGPSIPFLRSHPTSRERIDNLEALAERLSPKD